MTDSSNQAALDDLAAIHNAAVVYLAERAASVEDKMAQVTIAGGSADDVAVMADHLAVIRRRLATAGMIAAESNRAAGLFRNSERARVAAEDS